VPEEIFFPVSDTNNLSAWYVINLAINSNVCCVHLL
jgi:hypothetical protein